MSDGCPARDVQPLCKPASASSRRRTASARGPSAAGPHTGATRRQVARVASRNKRRSKRSRCSTRKRPAGQMEVVLAPASGILSTRRSAGLESTNEGHEQLRRSDPATSSPAKFAPCDDDDAPSSRVIHQRRRRGIPSPARTRPSRRQLTDMHDVEQKHYGRPSGRSPKAAIAHAAIKHDPPPGPTIRKRS